MNFFRKVDDWARTKESILKDESETKKKWGNEDLDPTP